MSDSLCSNTDFFLIFCDFVIHFLWVSIKGCTNANREPLHETKRFSNGLY